MRPSSIVLLSGGLDSVHAFLAARAVSDVLFALTFDYGQRSKDKEISAAQKICAHYDIAHKVLGLGFFSHLAGHPIFDTNAALPQPNTDALDDPDLSTRSAKAVWVPNRNGVFLNIAAALAEAALAEELYVGFNSEEAATFPDNSQSFVDAANAAFALSTQNQVRVKAPAVKLNKTEIVADLIKSEFDFSLLWSCYEAGKKMCGRCESCQRLKRALNANQRSAEQNELFLWPN